MLKHYDRFYESFMNYCILIQFYTLYYNFPVILDVSRILSNHKLVTSLKTATITNVSSMYNLYIYICIHNLSIKTNNGKHCDTNQNYMYLRV